MEFIAQYSQLNNPEQYNNQQSEDNFERLKRKLVETLQFEFKNNHINLVSDTNPAQAKQSEQNNNNNILLSALVNSPFQSYQYLLDIVIDFTTCSIKINSLVLHNGLLINLQKQGIQQSIFRFCLQFNSRCRNVSVNVNPLDGTIKATNINHFYKDDMHQFLKRTLFSDIIWKQITIMLEAWNNHILYKILLLSNKLLPENILKPKHQLIYENPITKCSLQLKKRLQTMSTIICSSHIKYPFMESTNKKDQQQKIGKNAVTIRFGNQLKQQNNNPIMNNLHFTNYIDKRTYFLDSVSRCMRMYTNCEQELYCRSITAEQQDISKFQQDHLNCDGIYVCPPKILNDLIIQSVEGETKFENGGYAQINRITAKVYKVSEQKNQKKPYPQKTISQKCETIYLIKKIAHMNKLWRQKMLVKRMGQYKCLFIQKYYNSVDRHFQTKDEHLGDMESLYMDYCPKKSLNFYLAHYKSITSLQLKLFFLYQVSIGLRFLRDINIVHLDLKPQNILMRIYKSPAWLVLRLIDFGQSYCHIEVLENSQRRGFTIPYASPQLIRQDSNSGNNENDQRKFVQKSDVFSLGVMILMIIFEINTTQIKRLGAKAYYNDQYTKLYNLCIERCREFGYEPLMISLLNLAYKCIRPQKYSRPLLDWVCVIFRQSCLLLEQLTA